MHVQEFVVFFFFFPKEKSFPTVLSLAVGLKSHNVMKQDLNSHIVKKKKRGFEFSRRHAFIFGVDKF